MEKPTAPESLVEDLLLSRIRVEPDSDPFIYLHFKTRPEHILDIIILIRFNQYKQERYLKVLLTAKLNRKVLFILIIRYISE